MKGKVECLDRRNCAPVNVILSSTHSQGVARKQIEVKGDGKFHFTSVLPAAYKLAVSEDNRCWETPTQELLVSSNIDNIIFKQLGYYVTVNSRYSTTLLLSNQEDKQIQEVSIRKGENVICVKSNKMVSLSTRGCEEFEIMPNKINLADEVFPTVTMKPIRYRVSGNVKAKKEIADLGLTAKVRQ